jgi:pyruvate/2-oxoglutarate dehydrogenase complex dihydrolipoamide dehydrogenase (E3) component
MLGSARRRRGGGLRRRPPAQDTQEILGAHMVGPESTEGIAQVVLAMEAGIGYRQLLRLHHLHPSMAEVVGLAIRLDDLARNA